MMINGNGNNGNGNVKRPGCGVVTHGNILSAGT
jgi:hypothetical protein